jgi:hypothetical protein
MIESKWMTSCILQEYIFTDLQKITILFITNTEQTTFNFTNYQEPDK